MNVIGKTIFIFGIIIAVIGIIFMFTDKIPFLGKLPGDIKIERGNTTFYFPIATCILISVIISLILYLVNKFSK